MRQSTRDFKNIDLLESIFIKNYFPNAKPNLIINNGKPVYLPINETEKKESSVVAGSSLHSHVCGMRPPIWPLGL
jgi:hypothetical protein